MRGEVLLKVMTPSRADSEGAWPMEWKGPGSPAPSMLGVLARQSLSRCRWKGRESRLTPPKRTGSTHSNENPVELADDRVRQQNEGL